MSVLSPHLEFAPPPEGGGGRSIGLALLVHLLLVAALTWGIRWDDSDKSMAVEAELWSAIPMPAAPRAVEPEPLPPETPVPVAPEPPPPPPKVTAKPPPTPPAALREAQLAIEREKQKKLDKEKKLEEEKLKQKQKEKELKDKKEKLEKEKQAKLEKDKHEREKLEKEKLEKDKKDKIEKEKQAKQKAEQEAKDRAESKRLEAQRQENLKRNAGLAGAAGAPTDTGTALKASGPSASYGGRIRAKVKPNITFGDDIAGNPMAEVEVHCAPDGKILSKRLLQSSGHKSWDDAVLKALEKTDTLPRDVDGRVPAVMVISFRPKD